MHIRMRLLSTYLMSYHRARNAAHCGKEFEVLARRQQVEEDVVLRTDPGHAAYRPHVVGIAHIVAEYKGGAGCRWGQTREDVEEGGLAGAVVAEDGGDLTLVDSEVDAVHRLNLRTPALVERFVEVGYPDRLAALHLAHHRLHVAIRLLARNERVRLAVRRRHLQTFLWKQRPWYLHNSLTINAFIVKRGKFTRLQKSLLNTSECLSYVFTKFLGFLYYFEEFIHQ